MKRINAEKGLNDFHYLRDQLLNQIFKYLVM